MGDIFLLNISFLNKILIFHPLPLLYRYPLKYLHFILNHGPTKCKNITINLLAQFSLNFYNYIIQPTHTFLLFGNNHPSLFNFTNLNLLNNQFPILLFHQNFFWFSKF